MEEELEEQESETIILSRKTIYWIEEDKELLIEDHLFDVQEIITVDEDTVCVKGLFDLKEDALYASLQESLFNRKTEKTNTIFPLVFFQLTFESTDLYTFRLNAGCFYTKTAIPYHGNFFPRVYYSIDYPPPNSYTI